MSERIISPTLQNEEKEDSTIRPTRFDDFVGQDAIKENLKIAIHAAKQRKEPLDHLLFSGPPGLGKTTLASIVAKEMGANIKTTSGKIIEKAGDVAALLTQLKKGDILFIDEIHRINPLVEEILYPAMEDGFIDVKTGEGASARSIRLTLEPFTLIGATTKQGLLGAPFRDRFGIISRLDPYNVEDLVKIVSRSAKILKIPLTPEGAMEIAKRSRGTPRVTNRILRRVRDYSAVKGNGTITPEIIAGALKMMQIDECGLDDIDRRILTYIANSDGKPVGLKTLAIAIGEDLRTVEDVYEPYLIQTGFIRRTPQGRELTVAARKHLNLEVTT